MRIGHNAWQVLTAVTLWIWYAVIAAKLAVLVLIVKRRIPAFVFSAAVTSHLLRSLWLLTLRTSPKEYAAVVALSDPWISAMVACAAVEAYVLIVRRLPKFEWPSVIVFGITAAIATTAAWTAWGGNVELASGVSLGVFLVAAAFIFDWLRNVDRGALHHAVSLALCALVGSAALGFFQVTGGKYEPASSIINSSGVLIAYLNWIFRVHSIDTSSIPHVPVTSSSPHPASGKLATWH